MRRAASVCVFLALALSAHPAAAQRQPAFAAEAFNAAVAFNERRTTAFSPLAFEFDAAAFAEAFDTITRAHFAETLGVLTDFGEVYGGIAAHFAALTNGVRCASARALCLPEPKKSAPVYRAELQRVFSGDVCRLHPILGAERWLQAALDGDAEDLRLPDYAGHGEWRYSFFDVAFVHVPWTEPFAAAESRPFAMADGKTWPQTFLTGVRAGALWETRHYALLKLPMADGAAFTAILPNAGLTVTDVRGEFAAGRVESLLTVTDSLTAKGVYRGPVRVAIPKMEIASDIALDPVFRFFKFPLKGFRHIDARLAPRDVRQRVRFRLDGAVATVPEPKEEGDRVLLPSAAPTAPAQPKTVELTRPFLFFVSHAKTRSILVAGVFMGR